MRIALAQINPTLGDFKNNCDKVIEFIHRAHERRCEVVLLPEAAMFGYHPMDLLERASVVEAQEKELKRLHKKIPDKILVLVGAIVKNPKKDGKPFLNAAVALQKNKPMKVLAKELLPTYDVFDEARHIEPGDVTKNIVKFKGKKLLITICEDIWAWPDEKKESKYKINPLKKIKAKDVDIVLNLSASPFTRTKQKQRMKMVSATVKHLKAPMVYVNMVGAQDELVFDGGSFAMNKKGKVLAECIRFEEDLNVVDFATNEGGLREQNLSDIDLIHHALVLGLRDFVEKIGFEKVHLGLSGGIDSALVACLAVDALGPQRVSAYALPGPHSTEKSLNLAKSLAENLGIDFKEMSINSIYDSLVETFNDAFGDLKFGLVQENFQARARGLVLMGLSNKDNSLLLNTSNKSELAMGYSTLYGDQAGGICVIGDLLKSEVFDLSRHYNKEHELIPREIISRAPSAELRPNQKDIDTLPPYSKLDPTVEKLVVNRKAARTDLEKRVLNAMIKSEFKRWQAPPILKVTAHSFGRGRRLPVAHKALY